MRNFRLIEQDIGTGDFMRELHLNDTLWYQNTVRQDRIAIHKDTLHIPLRSAVDEEGNIHDIFPSFDDHGVTDTSFADFFPKLMTFLEIKAYEARGSLERVMLVLLKPDKHVSPHVDFGDYFVWRDRYHLVLQSGERSGLVVEDEEVDMKNGELWCWNNKKMHSAYNKGIRDRVHVIFDIKPHNNKDNLFKSFSFKSFT